MFALLRKKNPYMASAERVYAGMLTHVRHPKFYSEYGVPDSFDGRFDLLLLHGFLVINRMGSEGKEFSQALFDVMFADMDQTLREIGIGDMGVPKHMRRMMKAFNGRMHVYADAFAGGRESLKEALRRNLYGTLPDVTDEILEKMVSYVLSSVAKLKQQPDGEIVFEE